MLTDSKSTIPEGNDISETFEWIQGADYINDLVVNQQCNSVACSVEVHPYALEEVFPPPSNTGGNPKIPHVAPPTCQTKLAKEGLLNSQKTIIDYLTFTTPYSPERLIRYMSLLIPGLDVFEKIGGFHGYRRSWNLMHGGVNIGIMGSEMSREAFLIPTFDFNGTELPRSDWKVSESFGRNLFSLSGAGTKLIQNWGAVFKILTRMKARISRIDLAMDFFRGEVTYEDAYIAAYGIPEENIPRSNWKIGKLAGGEFCSLKGGRRSIYASPITPVDHRGSLGRTLTLGSPKGSKKICIYEKGYEQYNKLLAIYEDANHDLHSTIFNDPKRYGCPGNTNIREWVRVEVRYGNCDRILGLDMLLHRDNYFSGACPFCARVLQNGDGIKPETIMTKTEVNIEKLTYYARQGYGGLLFALKEIGYSNDEIVHSMIGEDFSNRMKNDGAMLEILGLQQKKAFSNAFVVPALP